MIEDLSPSEYRKVAAFGLDTDKCTPRTDHVSVACGEGAHGACRPLSSAWCDSLGCAVSCLCGCHRKAES